MHLLLLGYNNWGFVGYLYNLGRFHEADLARGRGRRPVQIPKYGQIRTESRLFRAPSRRHVTFPCCC